MSNLSPSYNILKSILTVSFPFYQFIINANVITNKSLSYNKYKIKSFGSFNYLNLLNNHVFSFLVVFGKMMMRWTELWLSFCSNLFASLTFCYYLALCINGVFYPISSSIRRKTNNCILCILYDCIRFLSSTMMNNLGNF